MKAFEISLAGQLYTFDSFECAIQALAPTCEHCGCRILGHGVEAHDAGASALPLAPTSMASQWL
jgi:hypothetical protein